MAAHWPSRFVRGALPRSTPAVRLLAAALLTAPLSGACGEEFTSTGAGGDGGGGQTTSAGTTGGSTPTGTTPAGSGGTGAAGAAGGRGGAGGDGARGGSGGHVAIACADQYGAAEEFVLCEQTELECQFEVSAGGLSCNAVCRNGGGECLGEYQLVGACQPGSEVQCTLGQMARILCRCSRGCGIGPPCLPPEHCVGGICQ